MTCIVGLETEDTVWIGSDSFWGNSSKVQLTGRRKVFHVGEGSYKTLFGVTGSPRVSQLLHFGLDVPERDDDQGLEHYLVTKFVDAVRECLKDGGALQEEDGVETVRGWSGFLLGFQGRLVYAASDLQMTQAGHKYTATGAGDKFALAAMAATEGLIEDPLTRIHEALRATERHSPMVESPFIIKSLSHPDLLKIFDD